MGDLRPYTLRAGALLTANHPAAWLGGQGEVLTPEQQLRRISETDPLGFLIAICKGEPILSFRLEPVAKRYRKAKPTGGRTIGTRRVLRCDVAIEDGLRVLAEYWTPSISDRMTAARVLYGHQLPLTHKPAAPSAPVDRDPAYTRMIKESLEKKDAEKCSESSSPSASDSE